MRKKILSIMLSLSMLIAFMPIIASAETSGTCGINLTWKLSSNGTLTISGTGAMKDYVYDPSPFSDNNSIKSIVIEDGVTYIGKWAFMNCTSVSSVKIGNDVTDINYNAFSGCTGLKNITLSNSVKSICNGAFAGCTSLTSINIPKNTVYIEDGVFSRCTSLTSINVDSTNEKYSSVNGVLFNKKQTYLLKYPMGKTDSSYTIPDGVKEIGAEAFMDCSSLTNIIFPDSLTNIYRNAFSSCTSLTNITIPGSVTSIYGSVFASCTNLTNITLGDGIQSIFSSAFANCSSLTNITIPESVTTIGDFVFSNCSSLVSINVSENNQKYSSEDGVLFNKDKTNLIQYPIAKTDSLYIVSDSVTSIKNYAFSKCTGLTSVIIPDSVTSIDHHAFNDCTGLASVSIGRGLTKIESYVFSGCTSLTDFIFPDNITSIGYGAFSGCKNLTNVYYTGTEEMWNKVDGYRYEDVYYSGLTNAVIHYNYTITSPDTYEISGLKTTDSGVSFTVRTMEAVSGKQAAIIACYDENGAFLGLQEKQITAFPDGQERQEVSFDIDKEKVSTIKAFVWNAMQYMMPASRPVSLEL